MLMDLLSRASTIAMLAFVISSMLAMGVGLSVSQIVHPLRNPRLVAFALLSNFVLMPLCALALSTVLRLDQPLGVGMLLLGSAAGAPFLPKLAELAKGNLPFAVGTMVLLMVVTVGYLPVVLPLLLPGVAVNPARIAQSLVLLILLPLGIGLALKSRYEELAARVKPVLDRISNLSLVLLVSLITAANIDKVLESSARAASSLAFCSLLLVLPLVGCSGDRATTRGGSWHWVLPSATLPHVANGCARQLDQFLAAVTEGPTQEGAQGIDQLWTSSEQEPRNDD